MQIYYTNFNIQRWRIQHIKEVGATCQKGIKWIKMIPMWCMQSNKTPHKRKATNLYIHNHSLIHNFYLPSLIRYNIH